MALHREELRQRIEEDDLIQDYPHLDTQLTANGFDLTAGEIHRYEGSGQLDFSNDERELPETTPIEPEKRDASDEYGWWELDPGVYKIVANETVRLPNDLMAFTVPRSSLLRMGATIDNAAWEAGFEGRGAFMLHVENPEGIAIKENARVNQIVFVPLEGSVEDGYDGMYRA
ncbi:MAG: deoxyuridine 5'-triphosphate nucleotidohydrolase [Candidatus Nanohaloarchaea archaeon]|nr:deoxyuridine 5'-triphosphate nucleotidohydrolase [Candidatus Nanohaloarchaea archaeon]